MKKQAVLLIALTLFLFFTATKVVQAETKELPETVIEQKEEPAEIKSFTAAKINKASALYKSSSLKNPVSTIYPSKAVYKVQKTTNEKYYEIQITGQKYWISTANLVEQKKFQTKNKTILAKNFKTKAVYTVYSSASKKSARLALGKTVQSLKSIDVVNGFYVIHFGSAKGYIAFDQTNYTIPNNSRVELVGAAKFYERVKGQNKFLGTLAEGTVVKVASSNATTIRLKQGKRTFFLSKAAVVSTHRKESFKAFKKAAYPVQLTSTSQVTLYANTQGKKLGVLKNNARVSLLRLSGNYGVIEFAGHAAYVKLKYFKHSNMVDPTKNISPAKYSYYVRVINQLYPSFTKLEQIGSSVEGRPLYALKVGTGKKEILMDASLHAREHMTTNVLMEMIDQYTVSYRANTRFSNYHTRAVLNKTAIWFVPMMNPDGVTLVQSGLKAMTKNNQKTIQAYNKSSNYKRWKANGRGVDLNRNFDGVWSELGKTSKSFMGYKGPRVFSEPESQALRNFVLKHQFKTYYSYHSSGQVLYWFNFQNKKNFDRDLKLTKKVAKITGYSVMKPVYSRGSGSSVDWFLLKEKQPGITMEIAPYSGNGPVPHRHWSKVWAKNKTIGLFGANEAAKR